MTRFTLLASAAALAAAPAFADNHGDSSSNMESEGMNTQSEMSYRSGTMDSADLENMIRTSNIVGGDIYAVDREDEWAESEWNELDFVESVDDGWEDIGNITDVVLSPDGKQVGLIISHGGFLDIGDDTVLLTMDDVRRIGTIDSLDGDFNYVTRMTEDQIESMQEVEENWF
jgi:sporulation protein YlmC with PRC-barrel domain